MRKETRRFHQSLTLTNFTAFATAKLEFVPGVNAIIGENGTGKTHILKALYSIHNASHKGFGIREKFANVFQVPVNSLIRASEIKIVSTRLAGMFGGTNWFHELYGNEGLEGPVHITTDVDRELFPKENVFIPAIDMMGHTKGFLSTYQHREIDFDETLNDIVANLLLPPLKKLDDAQLTLIASLEEILGGKLELEGERFYLAESRGRFEMPAIAEGLRKVATLIRLIQVGALSSGSTLFWDEPEVNLNPIIMDEVVGAILALSRAGVQVFVATHSYVILKELEVQSLSSDSLRFFSLEASTSGSRVHPASSYLELRPNKIEQQYSELYDRGLDKAMGANGEG